MATYENVDPFDSIMNALLSNVKELNLFFRAIQSNIVIKEGKHSSIRKIDFLPKYNQEEPEVVLKDDELEIYYVIKHKKRNDINVPFMMLEFTTELIRLSVEEKEKELEELTKKLSAKELEIEGKKEQIEKNTDQKYGIVSEISACLLYTS